MSCVLPAPSDVLSFPPAYQMIQDFRDEKILHRRCATVPSRLRIRACLIAPPQICVCHFAAHEGLAHGAADRRGCAGP